MRLGNVVGGHLSRYSRRGLGTAVGKGYDRCAVNSRPERLLQAEASG